MPPRNEAKTENNSPEQELKIASKTTPPPKKLLVINPNTSQSMSEGLNMLIEDMGPSSIFEITTYTASSGLASINSESDATRSAFIVLEELESRLDDYDAFLVACYSVHPLVARIRERVDPAVQVTGIFEASIAAAMTMLPQRWETRPRWGIGGGYEMFGIVSTGSYWEKTLTKGVMEFLGASGIEAECDKFRGVETTGLTASELHTADPEEVKQKVKDATKRLVKDHTCSVVCLGCAGMAGMDDIVREAVVEELGEEQAEFIRIVDGVKAGIVYLEGVVRILPDRRKERALIKPEKMWRTNHRGELVGGL